MAVQDQEGAAAAYSGPREQVHRQTLQETVCAQTQGRAGGPRGTSATCGCSFLVPSLSPVQRHGCSCCSPCCWSESSDSEPARVVQGTTGTGRRAGGECTTGKPRSVIYDPTWDTPGRGCAHTQQGHSIARWPGSWAFLLGPAKTGLHRGVAERELGRGQGEFLLGKLGSSPSPHGLQVC